MTVLDLYSKYLNLSDCNNDNKRNEGASGSKSVEKSCATDDKEIRVPPDCLVYLVFKHQLSPNVARVLEGYCTYVVTSCTSLYRSVMYTGLATNEKWFLYNVGLKLSVIKYGNEKKNTKQ